MKMIVSKCRPAAGGYHATTLQPAKGEDGILGQVEMLTKRRFDQWAVVELDMVAKKAEEKKAPAPTIPTAPAKGSKKKS